MSGATVGRDAHSIGADAASVAVVEHKTTAKIRQALDDATTVQSVKAIVAEMWRAYGAGLIVEAEAEALSVLSETRKSILTTLAQDAEEARATADRARTSKAVARRGSAPRSQESLDRRRRWVASGRLPPALAARFTPGEQAVLAVVAAEAQGQGRLPPTHRPNRFPGGRVRDRGAQRPPRSPGARPRHRRGAPPDRVAVLDQRGQDRLDRVGILAPPRAVLHPSGGWVQICGVHEYS